MNDDFETTAEHTSNNLPVRQQLVFLALILFLIFGSIAIPDLLARLQPEEPVPDVAPTITYTDAPNTVPQSTSLTIVESAIGAKAAYVWDVTAQRALFKKEADAVLPLASITKLMTALVAFELIDNETPVAVGQTAIRQYGSSGLSDGESFRFEELRDLTLLTSSNDGAYAIAAAAGELLIPETPLPAFVDSMNIRAEELGLTQTVFYNPTGLDISNAQAGSYGSARDVTFLMEYLLLHHPDILEATRESEARIYNTDGAYHDSENTNRIVTKIPELIGSKTGYTELAGGNLTIAFDAGLNRPVIVTVLGSSRNGRFADVETLVAAVREYYTQ